MAFDDQGNIWVVTGTNSASYATGNAGLHQNVPTTPIVVESAKLLTEKK